MLQTSHGTISLARQQDAPEVLALYRLQLGREFCPWSEQYPGEKEIAFDLSRDALLIMRSEEGALLAAISLDLDENVEALTCWDPDLTPVCELSRIAVHPDHQGKGIAREMIRYAMEQLRQQGYRGVHMLVNRYNQKALRSYAVFGFTQAGECGLYQQPYLCMEKQL